MVHYRFLWKHSILVTFVHHVLSTPSENLQMLYHFKLFYSLAFNIYLLLVFRSNGVIHVRSKYDLENRLKSAGSKLVVIDFFATWCGPCKMIAPELERMAKDFPGVVFLKVDVDENGDVSREYSVSAMPTFVFLKNRREVSRIRGADSHSLRSTIQRYKWFSQMTL